MTLKKFLTIGFVAAVLVACGDDSSSAIDSGEDSSSSICEDCDGSSSSKAKSSSSSSVFESETKQSSDSKSSSSSVKSSSSSAKSSSSKENDTNFSSSAVNSSSSETGESSSSVPEGFVDPSTVVKGTVTDERDGQTYKTVKIGSQTWMAENLNFATDGSVCYNDSAEYCAKYGRLYQWSDAMDSVGRWGNVGKGCGSFGTCEPEGLVRGVCPEGWHLPKTKEWEILFAAAGGKYSAGVKLRSTSGWKNDRNGTDDYSFTAVPAGGMGIWAKETFVNGGNYAFFWSSTEEGSFYAYYMYLKFSSEEAAFNTYYSKDFWLSVRCVMD